MSIHLLSGDDESVLRDAVHDLVHRLVGDGDRSLMVDEFDGAEYELRAVVDAAQTLPMFTERRVVVARGVGRFVVADLDPLLAYLAAPLEPTDLVLVWFFVRTCVLLQSVRLHSYPLLLMFLLRSQ